MVSSQTEALLMPVKADIGSVNLCHVEVTGSSATEAEPVPVVSTRFTATDEAMPAAVLIQNCRCTASVKSFTSDWAVPETKPAQFQPPPPQPPEAQVKLKARL